MDKQVPGVVVLIAVLMIVCVTFAVMGGLYLSRGQAVLEQADMGETAVIQPDAVEAAAEPLPEPELEETLPEALDEDGLSLESVMSGFPELADKLEACEPFSQPFIHPFGGEEMERRVIGMDDSDCIYQETMPNNGLMECRYPEDMRKAVAQSYRAMAEAEAININAEISLGGDSDVTTTLDGEVAENPLQEAMDSGLCTISGY